MASSNSSSDRHTFFLFLAVEALLFSCFVLILCCFKFQHCCHPPATECQQGRCLNSTDLQRKAPSVPTMLYSNRAYLSWQNRQRTIQLAHEPPPSSVKYLQLIINQAINLNFKLWITEGLGMTSRLIGSGPSDLPFR